MAYVAFLTDLWVASWYEALPGIDFGSRRDWLSDFLHDPAHVTFVAVGAAGPLGFVTVAGAYLHQLVVAPAAKGSGLADRLLDWAKARAPAGLALDVNQANTRAFRFYERAGFMVESAGMNPLSGLATWRLHWTGS